MALRVLYVAVMMSWCRMTESERLVPPNDFEAVFVTEAGRYVAIADHYDLLLFYRQVARRLGQPTKFSDRLAYTHRIDPLKSWVIEHRTQFRALRDQQWRLRTRHPYDPRFVDAILPTNRPFSETRRPVTNTDRSGATQVRAIRAATSSGNRHWGCCQFS